MRPSVIVLENIHDEGIDELKQFAQLEEAYGLTQKERIERSKSSEVVIVKSVTKVDKEFIDACSKLKVIARAGTGLDNIDCEYAKSKNIKVLSVPTGNTKSAADFAMLLILASIRRLKEIMEKVEQSDFRRHLLEGRELSELTVGLVGLGNVGIEVAKRLNGFSCKMLAYDPYTKHKTTFEAMGGKLVTQLDELERTSDLITLHCNLTKENQKFINKDFFAKLDKPIFLVNTARGGLVDEGALMKALEEGKLLFYASDLLAVEPPFDLAPGEHSFTNPLIGHEKTIITPHVAASTIDAQKRIALDLVRSIRQSV